MIAVLLILVALVAAHLIALHEVGSNNPDGVEIKKTRIRSPTFRWMAFRSTCNYTVKMCWVWWCS